MIIQINNPLLKPYMIRINWSCHIYEDETKPHRNTYEKKFLIQFKDEFVMIKSITR